MTNSSGYPEPTKPGGDGVRGVIGLLVERHPAFVASTFSLLLLSSIFESIGIAMLIPLLNSLTGSTDNPSGLVRWINETIVMVGLRPNPVTLVTLVVGLILFKAIATFTAFSVVGAQTAKLGATYHHRIVNALTHARWHYFVSLPNGRVASAMASEVKMATNTYVRLIKVMTAAITAVVQLSVAFAISWPVALAGCVLGGVIALMSWRLVSLSRVMGKRRTEGVQMLTTRLLEAIGGMKALKGMGVEDRMEPLLRWEIGNIRSATRNLNILGQALRVIPEPVAAVFIGISLVIYLQILGGQLEAFLVLALLMSRSMQSIGQMQRSYQSVLASEPSFWFVENLIREARAHGEQLHGTRKSTLNEEIRFNQASFRYGGQKVLCDVDLVIEAGKISAFTGLSGAGKTTLVDLVAGLQEPSSGTVTIDGVLLSDIDMRQWRSRIGYVLQETFLFHESIANNVTLGDPLLGKAEAEAALRKAGAWDFVTAWPEGLDTIVGERGSRLSGGQRQRIAIARALVREPTLLILDEPTVGLDRDTELGICQSLEKLADEVTILVVSHQPALFTIADRIYEVSDGSVRETSAPGIGDQAPTAPGTAGPNAVTQGV